MQIHDTPAFRARVWSHIDSTGRGCWPWTASCKPTGYGQPWDGKRNISAHRAIYEIVFRAIPDGMFVCHRCDNPPCCRPSHLFLGTHTDNMRDMLSKGRGIKPEQHARGARNGRRQHPERYGNVVMPKPKPGEANHQAKLVAADVIEIRRLATLGEVRRCDLAARYGISRAKISQIVLGQSWRHLL